jgi:hypothetical protein
VLKDLEQLKFIKININSGNKLGRFFRYGQQWLSWQGSPCSALDGKLGI